MSTRSNIILKDEYHELMFYRHCDGYPSGMLPLLREFVGLVEEGKIRDNVAQAAGWLVVLGVKHEGQYKYERINDEFTKIEKSRDELWNPLDHNDLCLIEPTPYLAGDGDYIYTVDLNEKTIHMRNTNTGLECYDRMDPSYPPDYYDYDLTHDE